MRRRDAIGFRRRFNRGSYARTCRSATPEIGIAARLLRGQPLPQARDGLRRGARPWRMPRFSMKTGSYPAATAALALGSPPSAGAVRFHVWNAKGTKMKADIYQTITDRIVDALESNVKPWHQPWSGSDTTRISRSAA